LAKDNPLELGQPALPMARLGGWWHLSEGDPAGGSSSLHTAKRKYNQILFRGPFHQEASSEPPDASLREHPLSPKTALMQQDQTSHAFFFKLQQAIWLLTRKVWYFYNQYQQQKKASSLQFVWEIFLSPGMKICLPVFPLPFISQFSILVFLYLCYFFLIFCSL
jgi:hypothetical protein